MRTTYTVLRVALILVNEPGEHYGYELLTKTGIRSGVMYPILRRMVDEGWLKARNKKTSVGKRPGRCYYRVTALGRREMTAMLQQADDDLRFK